MQEKFREVGLRIREVRKTQKLSQAKLAERLDISTSHMSDIENGKTNIGLDIFMKLTEVLQVSADWLLQTDAPSVHASLNKEFRDLLSDCSSAEKQTILKIVKEVKGALRKSE